MLYFQIINVIVVIKLIHEHHISQHHHITYKKLSRLLAAMLKKSARGLFERIQQNKHIHTHYTSSRASSKW
jgi:hypothetical protein